MIESTIEIIGPNEAARYLARSNNPRKLDHGAARNYARFMKEKQWHEGNGDTISFNNNGELIDGQTRMQALIISGLTFKFNVFRGIENGGLGCGEGRRRTFGQILEKRGVKYYCTVSSLCQNIHKHKLGTVLGNLRYAPAIFELENIYDEKQAEIDDAARRANINAYRDLGVTPGVIAFMLYCIGNEDNYENCNKFFDLLAKGAPLDINDPIYVLRQRLLADRRTHAKNDKTTMEVFIIKTWNLWIEGKPGKQLSWRAYGPKAEEYPKIKKSKDS